MSRYDESSSFVWILLALIFAGVLSAGIVVCAKLETIEPGHAGVSVRKCGGGGVAEKPIPTGYYWRELFCEEVIEYPTNLRTMVLTQSQHEGEDGDESITVTSSEGLPISVDVSMSYTLDPAKVPAIYGKYRQDIGTIQRTYLRQAVREALQGTFSHYTAEQIYGDKREVARAAVQTYLTDKLSKEGFIVSQFTINETRVPKQVTEAINSKVAMVQEAQRAEQEVRKKEAEAAQKVAEARGEAESNKARAAGEAEAIRMKAEAQAKANELLSKSLTPQLIQYEAARRWNGILPQFTGGAVPFVNVPHGN